MRLLTCTAGFTLLSLLLGVGGVGAAASPQIASLSCLFGTMLSLIAGAFAAITAPTQRAASAAGSVAGAVPVLVGCGVATVFGPIAAGALVQTVMLGFIVGAAGGTTAWFAYLPFTTAAATPLRATST